MKARNKFIQSVIEPVPVGGAANKIDEGSVIVTQAEEIYRIKTNQEARAL